MEIKGTIMVSPLMFQMEVGQESFLHSSAMILIEGSLFIDTRYGVSILKNYEKNYIFPIKRTGDGIDDFEIDFNVIFFLYNQKLTEKEMDFIQNDPYIIGPYEVKTEIYQPLQYREQTYPRMDLDELMESFTTINQYLESLPDDIKYLGDKKTLKRLIQEKLGNMPIDQLQNLEKDFEEIPEEENENGNFKNFWADEEILYFIRKKIAEAKNFSTMTIEELENEKSEAINSGNYELAAEIQAIIDKK